MELCGLPPKSPLLHVNAFGKMSYWEILSILTLLTYWLYHKCLIEWDMVFFFMN